MRPVFEEAKKICGNQPAVGVEIGVAYGLNAKDVLDNWDQLYLYLVDNYSEAPQREEGMRALLKQRSICFMIKDSLQAARELQGKQFDFVYVDGDHTYEGVKADLEAWYPLVKKGGIFGGDDYQNTTCPGVNQAVNEFVVKNGLFLYVVPNGGAVDWFVRV